MSNMHGTDYQLKLKQGLVANINTTATKNAAVTGEPHYTTDTMCLYVFDGTLNMPVVGRVPVVIKSADYTLTMADYVVVFTATATATLPAATGSGQTYRIICRTGTTTIDANGSETIKGSLTQSIVAGEDLIITDTATGLWE